MAVLKRLFCLGVCFSALFLLTGLLIYDHAEPRQYPLRVHSIGTLPARPAPVSEENRQPVARLWVPSMTLLSVVACRRVAACRLPDLPFHRQNFQAFHYPDEAG